MQPDPSWMAELSWFLRDKIGIDGCLWALAILVPAWLSVRWIRRFRNQRIAALHQQQWGQHP